MRVHLISQILLRWLSTIPETLQSRVALIGFALSFIVSGAVWWIIAGKDKALEQGMENLIPALAGGLVWILIVLFVKLGEARQAIRSEDIERRWMRSLQQSQAKVIAAWLVNRLADGRLGIMQASLFGSVTHHEYETSDVDVVLLYEQISDKTYVQKTQKLKGIATEFQRTFNKSLHFQRFLKREDDAFQDFLAKQSEPILLFRK